MGRTKAGVDDRLLGGDSDDADLAAGGRSPGLEDAMSDTAPAKDKKGTGLLVSFIAMVVIGLGNKIFQILQTRPMHNYPFFLNLYITFVYVPLSFMYIIPMIKYGTAISKESQQIPKHKFAVMGILDAIAGLMQVLAVTYIPNPSLVILLQQAAIPVSMVISFFLLRAKYSIWQCLGAAIVVVGIIVVLLPSFGSGGDEDTGSSLPEIVWVVIMILSCVPMTLSSVYKEKALGEVEIDAIYMNGWVALFQFLVSIPLAIPTAYTTNLPLSEVPKNTWDGMLCYVGENSVFNGTATHGMKLDDCGTAPLYVSIYVAFNLAYNILIILMLKYGSAALLWLALTIMVPMGNVAFALPFMPDHKGLHGTDIAGLVIIMGGLIIYRFLDKVVSMIRAPAGSRARTISFAAPEERSEAHIAAHFLGSIGAAGLEGAQAVAHALATQRPRLLPKTSVEHRNAYVSRLLGVASPHMGRRREELVAPL